MDILYTSFLQKLVQASSTANIAGEFREKTLLNLLSLLSLKIQEIEGFNTGV